MSSSHVFEAIGTKWVIDINDPLSDSEEKKILSLVRDRIERYDRTYSRFRTDSLVTHVSKNKGAHLFPSDADELFVLYKKFYDITDGLVTPLIGDTLVSAGYDAEYSLTPQDELHAPLRWEEVMSYEGGVLTTKEETIIDIGAGGKGHLVDIIGSLLEKEGVTSYVIDASGDIRHRSVENNELKVGLENPQDANEVVGVAQLANRSICGSSGSRRTWGNFHHIINPHTLTSPRDVLSVWAVAETTFLADMLTTALFFVHPHILLPHFAFEYAMLRDGMKLDYSSQFPGEFFT